MKIDAVKIIILVALLLPEIADAQTSSVPMISMSMPNDLSFSRSIELFPDRGSQETPTMRRQKLARAIALREEAATLLRQDGGTLTARHQAYIRGKADAIRAYGRSRAPVGIVPVPGSTSGRSR